MENNLNEPQPRRPGFPFHEVVDDLGPKEQIIELMTGITIEQWEENNRILDQLNQPKPQIVFRNSISIETAGERPMRQESTSDLSFLD